MQQTVPSQSILKFSKICKSSITKKSRSDDVDCTIKRLCYNVYLRNMDKNDVSHESDMERKVLWKYL